MRPMMLSNRTSMIAMLLLLTMIIGCGDHRLAEMAQRTTSEQARQNQRMADQSEAIVKESHQLAQTAKQLVESDAQARRELIAAQQEMTSELNDQRSVIYAGHDQLETDRRTLAAQRQRDPIIAAAISGFGLMLACLLPLAVAALVAWRMLSQEPDHAAVAELLTLQLVSDTPLITAAAVPKLASDRDSDPQRLELSNGDLYPDELPF